MNLSSQIAKQFNEMYFGGNWTAVNLKQTLSDVSWRQAVLKLDSYNSIVSLVYHIGYYVTAVTKVLEGGPLDAHDKYSFNHPVVASEADWQNLLDKTWSDAKHFINLIEQLPANRLSENFSDPKYGNYYRNITGVIEHTHYHMGQIVLIKKMLLEMKR